MATESVKGVFGRAALRVGILLLLAFYFAQHSRMAENHTDGGLMLTYVEDMANGLMPHHDFIDAYGVLNWPPVVLFYKLAGHKVWGIRVWMVLLKVIIVVVAFKLTRRLAGPFYATLAALWMTLLYGVGWQSVQTAYGFNNVIPYVFGSWYFLLCGPFSQRANLIVAGILTGIAVWIKVNSGLFLFAAGLFHCFYWLPPSASGVAHSVPGWFARLFRFGQYAGLLVFAAVFYRYIREYFDVWYFAYLIGPLLIGLLYTSTRMARVAAEDVPVRHHLRAFSVYGAVTVVFVVAVLLITTGPGEVARYIADQTDIILYLSYMLPFSPLGVPGQFVGFNENYWLQVPWLFTLVFLAWIQLHARGRARAAFGERWETERSRGVGLYMMATLYQFSMYSRADETHVYQSLIVVPPALFALLAQIEQLLRAETREPSRPFRLTVASAAIAWGSTLFTRPGFAVFDLTTGELQHPKLEYIRYRELDNPYVRDFSPDITDHAWDRLVDEAAAFIDGIVPDEEPILVMDANRLIHVLSNTRPVGGRYHYYFYMISTKLYRRAGFEQAVPRHVLQEILDNPPLVAVGAYQRVPPVAQAFPEIRRLVTEKYRFVRSIGHSLIYVLKEEHRGHRPEPPPAVPPQKGPAG
jgi:hypothetical protein